MPAVTYQCEFEGCDWKVETANMEHYIALLKIHVEARHRQTSVSVKAEKAKRPELTADVSDEDWSYFESRWTQYKKATGLTGEDIVTQLLECCNEALRRDHHRTFSGATEGSTEELVLSQLKQIAVSKRNKAVNRVKLAQLKQDRGEPVRKFAGRIRSLAAVSEFNIKCTKAGCNTSVNYQESVIHDQVVRGLSDPEIQKDVLAKADDMDLETLLKYIEGKESALTSQGLMSGSGTVAANQHGQGRRDQRREDRRGPRDKPRDGQRDRQRDGQREEHGDTCPWCGEPDHDKKHCKAVGTTCRSCGKIGHFAKVCRSRSYNKPQVKSQSAVTSEAANYDSMDNCALFINNKDFVYPRVFIEKDGDNHDDNDDDNDRQKERTPLPARKDGESHKNKNNKTKDRSDPLPAIDYKKTLDTVMRIMVASSISASDNQSEILHHHVYDTHSESWSQRPAKKKPFVQVRIQVDKVSAKTLGTKELDIQTPEVLSKALADTGASVSMTGTMGMRSIGASETDLTRCSMRLYGADNSDIELLGVIPVLITDTATGRQTRQILYICNKASSLILSLEACEDLGYVRKDFAEQKTVQGSSTATSRAGKDPDCDCTCPVRERAPDAPTVLPFDPTPDNVPKMEQWIRSFYAASAFNTCECQMLPAMHGPPVKIHLQEGATPVASHSPIPVPLHWHKEVKAGLDCDVAIGVIEKVPSGTPTTWVHKMVCVAKKDNSPRRTVNFVPLNKHSSRETHHTMSPFHQASMVPANKYKTVLDAWNGYHSCALDEDSKHLTTFITPFGRYRYRTLPQGYLAAGDAYTERYDRIISEIEDKTKCVDDALLWKSNIKDQFFHTC